MRWITVFINSCCLCVSRKLQEEEREALEARISSLEVSMKFVLFIYLLKQCILFLIGSKNCFESKAVWSGVSPEIS